MIECFILKRKCEEKTSSQSELKKHNSLRACLKTHCAVLAASLCGIMLERVKILKIFHSYARMEVKMKSIVDLELCISCELCTNICPDVYSMGEDGYAHAIEEDIPEDKLEEAEDARDSCPTSAIDLD